MSGARDLDVAGIGSMVLDHMHRAPRILHSDEKGLLRALDDGATVRRAVGGVVLNHLGWAAVLGLRTGIFGRQADDETGRFLRAAMDRAGIERHLVLDAAASSTASIFVDDEGGRAIYMSPAATAETTPEHVRAHHAGFLRRAARVTTEVSQLPLATALEVLRLAAEAGIPTLLDLDVPPSDAVPVLGDEATLHAVLRAATLVKPAKAAARELAPGTHDALDLARALRGRFAIPTVVLTDGEAGCVIATDGFEGRVAAPVVKPVDTTGAGDAFLGGLLVALHLGLDWSAAGRLANACGAACVEQLGAFPEDAERARARVLELVGSPIALPPFAPRVASEQPPGERALEVLDVVVEEIARLRGRSRADAYEQASRRLREAAARGARVHVTGVGKASHVARYAAALFSSTGTPAMHFDATEAVHGSAGQIVAGDVVIAISNSGETEEMRRAVEAARALGASILGVTGNLGSWLGRTADVALDAGVGHEGGPLGLAPRASVAAQAMVLAALAALVEHELGFTPADYHARHPAGALGQRAATLARGRR